MAGFETAGAPKVYMALGFEVKGSLCLALFLCRAMICFVCNEFKYKNMYIYIYIKLNYDFVVTFIYSFYFDVFQIDSQHLYPMISHLLSEFDPRHRNDRRHLCLQLLAPTTMTHRYFVLKQLQSYKEIVGT